jgi:hypothetical protein
MMNNRQVRELLTGTAGGTTQPAEVTGSTQGFTLVPAALKALLEHNIRLNLVADSYQKGADKQARGFVATTLGRPCPSAERCICDRKAGVIVASERISARISLYRWPCV